MSPRCHGPVDPGTEQQQNGNPLRGRQARTLRAVQVGRRCRGAGTGEWPTSCGVNGPDYEGCALRFCAHPSHMATTTKRGEGAGVERY